MKSNTIADLKLKLSRAHNRADYWRWRRDNPAKYSLELSRNKVRA